MWLQNRREQFVHLCLNGVQVSTHHQGTWCDLPHPEGWYQASAFSVLIWWSWIWHCHHCFWPGLPCDSKVRHAGVLPSSRSPGSLFKKAKAVLKVWLESWVWWAELVGNNIQLSVFGQRTGIVRQTRLFTFPARKKHVGRQPRRGGSKRE